MSKSERGVLVPFQLDSCNDGPRQWADQRLLWGSHRSAQIVGTALAVLVLLLFFWAALPLPAQESAAGKKDQPSPAKKKAKGLAAEKAEEEEQEKEDSSAKGVKLSMKRRPSLRFGNVARVDFRAKVQMDYRGFYPTRVALSSGNTPTPTAACDIFSADPGCLFDFHRLRVSVEGVFLKHFEFEVERDIREDLRLPKFIEDVDFTTGLSVFREIPQQPWRDVYVNFRRFRHFQIKAGRFKLPFGFDQLSSDTDLPFVERSRIGDMLAPGREIGIMVHGNFFKRGLGYQAGLFRRDGENSLARDREPTGLRTFVGRVTGTPLRLLPLPKLVQKVQFGGDFTSSTVPPGPPPHGLRGRTVWKDNFFDHAFVKGERLRLGTDLSWTSGPFAVNGEFVHVRDQRLGQGIRGDDLSDLIARGWYVAASWVVTGEEHAKARAPERDLGALELVGRFDTIRFGSSEHPGRPSRTTRAANILGNSDRVWTFGVTWYLNRWVRIQGNGVREKIEDPRRAPIFGRERFWTALCQLQFVM